MSTKAIRVALNYLETITASGYFGHEALAEFKSEVEAIEAAARHYVSFEDMAGSPDDLMESIARDAP